MKRHGHCIWIGFAALGLAITSVILAREEPSKPDAVAKPWKDIAARYRIEIDTGHVFPLTFREEPVLKWTNPERKADDGAVFVWTDRGRPEVAACFYRYKAKGEPIEAHELVTLSNHAVSGSIAGEIVWSPPVGKAPPVPIPGAPRPAATTGERLRQMRTLAREFKATFNNPPDLSEIRLLTQPIYRFETEGKRSDVLDGALFAFVHTTDPEVLLMLEARPAAEKQEPTWHYTLARMSMVNMRVHHKDREVWSAQWDNELDNASKPYRVRNVHLTPGR